MPLFPQTRKITRTAAADRVIFLLVEAPAPNPGEQNILGNDSFRIRRLKANNLNQKAHGLIGQKQQTTVLSGYSAYLDKLLCQGVTNSAVCLDRLREFGFEGSLSTVKRYIKANKHLVPAKRQLVASQGNRGRRFTTEPGEAYQMDWLYSPCYAER